jgi:hypothetical protein
MFALLAISTKLDLLGWSECTLLLLLICRATACCSFLSRAPSAVLSLPCIFCPAGCQKSERPCPCACRRGRSMHEFLAQLPKLD